jgi:hypothetical protein
MGSFVRANAARLVTLRNDRGKDAATRATFTRGQDEVLREHIERRRSIAPQHPRAAPRRELLGGDAIARILGSVRRRFRQHDVDDIVRIQCRIPRALCRINHVVWGRDQGTQTLDGGISLTAKGRNEVSHELA